MTAEQMAAELLKLRAEHETLQPLKLKYTDFARMHGPDIARAALNPTPSEG